MTGPTAWIKIAARIRDILTAQRMDVVWLTYDESDPGTPLTEDQLPAVVISFGRTESAHSEEHGQLRHDSQLFFSIQSAGGGSASIDSANQDIAASIIEALHGSDDLSGAAEFMDMQSFDPTQQDAQDVGEALLTYQITFYTPIGNLRQIILPGGDLL